MMQINTHDMFCRRVSLLGDPGSRQRISLGELNQSISIRSGRVVFNQGGVSEYIYIIRSGVVRISHLLSDGRRQVLAFYGPGKIFGLAVGGKYINLAEALVDANLLRFRRDNFQSSSKISTTFQNAIFEKLNEKMHFLQTRLMVISKFNSLERLACFLREMCDQDNPHYEQDTSILKLAMSRVDIADYTATTIETLSRNFTELSKRKIMVKIDNTTLKIDLVSLSRIVDDEYFSL